MPSQVDFAIALGLFITFIALLVAYVINYVISFNSIATTSELRTVAYDFFNSLFGSKGQPTNWENSSTSPMKFGFSGDLYRTPILVTDTSGTNRTLTVNASITFDFYCQSKAWNDSVRIYNDTSELAFQFYNQTFCNTRFLNTSDVAFNLTFAPNQQQIVYVYYSGDTRIQNMSNYNVSFFNSSNVNVLVFPQETLSSASVSKIDTFRNKTFSDIIRTLALEYKFNIKISKG